MLSKAADVVHVLDLWGGSLKTFSELDTGFLKTLRLPALLPFV